MSSFWSAVSTICILCFLGSTSYAYSATSCHSIFSIKPKARSIENRDRDHFPITVLDSEPFSKRTVPIIESLVSAPKSAWTNRLHDQNGFYEALIADKNTEIHLIEGFRYSYGVREAYRQTMEKEHYFVETIDTLVRDNEWWGEAKGVERAEFSRTIKLAKKRRTDWLVEIADAVISAYSDRRNWGPEFIKKIRAKIFSTANSTRYTVYRHKNPDGTKGRIIGVIGLQKAPYGTVTFFNKKTNQWERRTGAFGPSYDSAYDSNFNLKAESIVKWDSPIPLLGAEVYLGVNFPRPSVVYKTDPSGTPRPPHELSTENFEVDTTKPVYYGAGEVFEPVRFYLAKKEDLKTEVYRGLVKDVFNCIFPNDATPEYSLNAQYLYTYNTSEGVRLYHAQGFAPLRSFPQLNKDNSVWTSLGASPQGFAEVVQSLLEKSQIEPLIHFFRESVDRRD